MILRSIHIRGDVWATSAGIKPEPMPGSQQAEIADLYDTDPMEAAHALTRAREAGISIAEELVSAPEIVRDLVDQLEGGS